MGLLDADALRSLIADEVRRVTREELVAPISGLRDDLRAGLAAVRDAQPPKLFSIRDAASSLAVSLSTVRRLVKTGRLPVVRVGGAVRVNLAGLESAEVVAERSRRAVASGRPRALGLVPRTRAGT